MNKPNEWQYLHKVLLYRLPLPFLTTSFTNCNSQYKTENDSLDLSPMTAVMDRKTEKWRHFFYSHQKETKIHVKLVYFIANATKIGCHAVQDSWPPKNGKVLIFEEIFSYSSCFYTLEIKFCPLESLSTKKLSIKLVLSNRFSNWKKVFLNKVWFLWFLTTLNHRQINWLKNTYIMLLKINVVDGLECIFP